VTKKFHSNFVGTAEAKRNLISECI